MLFAYFYMHSLDCNLSLNDFTNSAKTFVKAIHSIEFFSKIILQCQYELQKKTVTVKTSICNSSRYELNVSHYNCIINSRHTLYIIAFPVAPSSMFMFDIMSQILLHPNHQNWNNVMSKGKKLQ